jgi:hypothetical protein
MKGSFSHVLHLFRVQNVVDHSEPMSSKAVNSFGRKMRSQASVGFSWLNLPLAALVIRSCFHLWSARKYVRHSPNLEHPKHAIQAFD